MIYCVTPILARWRIFITCVTIITGVLLENAVSYSSSKNHSTNNHNLQHVVQPQNSFKRVNSHESLISRNNSKAVIDCFRHTLDINTYQSKIMFKERGTNIKYHSSNAANSNVYLRIKRNDDLERMPSTKDTYMQYSNYANLKRIKIAILLPFDEHRLFSIYKVVPAIEIAIAKVNTILVERNYTLVMKYRNSNCDSADGINEAINFYVHKEMDVLFGPCCDYAVAPCARQTRYWNIPMITAGALAGDFGLSKNASMTTLIRLGTNFNAMVRFLVQLMSYYNWKKVNVIYDPNGQQEIISKLCHIAADGIHYGLKQQGNQNFTNKYEKFEEDREILRSLPEKIGINCAITHGQQESGRNTIVP